MKRSKRCLLRVFVMFRVCLVPSQFTSIPFVHSSGLLYRLASATALLAFVYHQTSLSANLPPPTSHLLLSSSLSARGRQLSAFDCGLNDAGGVWGVFRCLSDFGGGGDAEGEEY